MNMSLSGEETLCVATELDAFDSLVMADVPTLLRDGSIAFIDPNRVTSAAQDFVRRMTKPRMDAFISSFKAYLNHGLHPRGPEQKETVVIVDQDEDDEDEEDDETLCHPLLYMAVAWLYRDELRSNGAETLAIHATFTKSSTFVNLMCSSIAQGSAKKSDDGLGKHVEKFATSMNATNSRFQSMRRRHLRGQRVKKKSV